MIDQIISLKAKLDTWEQSKFNVIRRLPSQSMKAAISVYKSVVDKHRQAEDEIIKINPLVCRGFNNTPDFTGVKIINVEEDQFKKLKIKAKFFDEFLDLLNTKELRELEEEFSKEVDFLEQLNKGK